ncbi:hypothetical protein Landi51_00697 [Colletotrichum acutatum]
MYVVAKEGAYLTAAAAFGISQHPPALASQPDAFTVTERMGIPIFVPAHLPLAEDCDPSDVQTRDGYSYQAPCQSRKDLILSLPIRPLLTPCPEDETLLLQGICRFLLFLGLGVAGEYTESSFKVASLGVAQGSTPRFNHVAKPKASQWLLLDSTRHIHFSKSNGGQLRHAAKVTPACRDAASETQIPDDLYFTITMYSRLKLASSQRIHRNWAPRDDLDDPIRQPLLLSQLDHEGLSPPDYTARFSSSERIAQDRCQLGLSFVGRKTFPVDCFSPCSSKSNVANTALPCNEILHYAAQQSEKCPESHRQHAPDPQGQQSEVLIITICTPPSTWSTGVSILEDENLPFTETSRP